MPAVPEPARRAFPAIFEDLRRQIAQINSWIRTGPAPPVPTCTEATKSSFARAGQVVFVSDAVAGSRFKGYTGSEWETGVGGRPEEVAALDEPFTVNNLASFVFLNGTSATGLAVEGGVLKTIDGNNHEWEDPSVSFTQGAMIVKINVSGKEPIVFLSKWVNAEAEIKAQVFNNELKLYSIIKGNLTDYGRMSVGLNTGTCWLVCRLIGNKIIGELWKIDPRTRAAGLVASLNQGLRTAFVEGELNAEAIAAAGASVSGHPGTCLAGYVAGFTTTTTTLDDWILVPAIAGNRYEF